MSAPVPPSPSPSDAEALRAGSRAERAAAYPVTDPRLAPLQADLVRRLRAAGVALPTPAFDALVLDMARVALQWSLMDQHGRGAAHHTTSRPVP